MKKKLKEQIYKNKIRINRKKTNRHLIIFLIIFICGYTLFFTSNLWLKIEPKPRYSYTLGTQINKNDRNMSIVDFIYSKDLEMMEIIIEIENLSLDDIDHYKWKVRIDGSFYDTKVVVDDEDFVVLRVDDVDEFKEVMLRLELKEEDKDDDIDFNKVRFYLNKNEIKRVETIKKEKTKNDYLKQSIRAKIYNNKKNIKLLESENIEIKKLILKAEDKIKKLNHKLKYEAPSEQIETQKSIDKLLFEREKMYRDIDINDEKINALKENINFQKGVLDKWD